MKFESFSADQNPDNVEGLDASVKKEAGPKKENSRFKRMLRGAAILASVAAGYAANDRIKSINADTIEEGQGISHVTPEMEEAKVNFEIPSAENFSIEEQQEEKLNTLIGIAESTMKLEAFKQSKAYIDVERYNEEIKELNSKKYTPDYDRSRDAKDNVEYVGSKGTYARAIEMALGSGARMTSESKIDVKTVLGIPVEISVDGQQLELGHFSYNSEERELLIDAGIDEVSGNKIMTDSQWLDEYRKSKGASEQ
jgi:hypothetical protein